MAKRWQEPVGIGMEAGHSPAAFDAIVRLAAESSGAAVAVLRLAGSGGAGSEGALYVAPGTAPLRIAARDPLALVDAVTATELGFAFFVAVPVRSEDTEALGMLAIMGDRPERPMEQILPALRQLAGMARDLIALRDAGAALSAISRHLSPTAPAGLAQRGR
jgi:hypothetical protein